MASSLDLSLPAPPKQRQRGGIVAWLTLFVAASVLALVVLDRKERSRPAESAANTTSEADRLKSLATELEKRTLYVQADQVWAEYAALARLSPQEEADLLYRRGKCLKEGGRPAEAARRLSEVDTFPVTREEKRKARALLIECLDALGKRDVRDSLSRSFAIGEETKGTAVARVGEDVITREELRDDLVGSITEMMKMQGAPMTPAELAQKASELADQELKDPEASRRAVQQAVSRRVLYLEGLEREFADDKTTLDAFSRFRREYIANRVIEAETEGAMKNLGPTEVKNHYEANKARFVEKAGVEFSFARFPGAAEAEAAIAKLKDPARAASVKLERPGEPAVSGEPVPEIGMAPEATAHLLALGDGEISKSPIEAAGAFYVFRAEKRRPERQLTAEEAEPKVRADLAQAKRKEAMENLRTLLSQKFKVELLDAAAKPREEAAQPGGGTQGEGKAPAEGKAPPENKKSAESKDAPPKNP